MLIKKPTNWAIKTSRDGISDLIAKELDGAGPPAWYINKFAAKTNAIWRIGVSDRAEFTIRKLKAQRADDIASVRDWMNDTLEEDEDKKRVMTKKLGLDYDETFSNGPLGGARPSQEEIEACRRRMKASI